ncbi:MAG: hypothetical protein U0790_14165 [Isosphaeraceae bacterium]
MGFFDALKRVLSHESPARHDEETRKKIRDAWGLVEEAPEEDHGPEAAGASAYDRNQWQKKLRKLLDELPGSQGHWHDVVADAHALDFEPDWIAERQEEEFRFLIRRAVADRVISEEEHERIELARRLLGIPEAAAEETLRSIMAEAEAFFGKPVRDEA